MVANFNLQSAIANLQYPTPYALHLISNNSIYLQLNDAPHETETFAF